MIKEPRTDKTKEEEKRPRKQLRKKNKIAEDMAPKSKRTPTTAPTPF